MITRQAPRRPFALDWARGNPFSEEAVPGIRIGGCNVCAPVREMLRMAKVTPVIFSPYEAGGSETVSHQARSIKGVSREVAEFYRLMENYREHIVSLAQSLDDLEVLLDKTDRVERVIVANSFMRNVHTEDGFDYRVTPTIIRHVNQGDTFNQGTALYLINHGASVVPAHLAQVLRSPKPCYFMEKPGSGSGFRKVYK